MKLIALVIRPVMALLLACLTYCLSQSSAAAAPGVLDTVVYAPSGHLLVLLDNSNWADAEAAAIQLGGHLVTINDLAENSFIFSRWGTDRNLWIGLNDAVTEGTFVWSSGEPVTFTNWRPGEPNNGNNGEDFAYILGNGLGEAGSWNDAPDGTFIDAQFPLYGVVEVPEPSTMSFLMASGLLLLWTWRRRAARQSS